MSLIYVVQDTILLSKQLMHDSILKLGFIHPLYLNQSEPTVRLHKTRNISINKQTYNH